MSTQIYVDLPVGNLERARDFLESFDFNPRFSGDTALGAGGRARSAPQNHGLMYAQGFENLDGHQWELVFMDPAAAATPG